MVARIVELGAAHATVHYFERDGYYAKNDPEHRRASFWHGRGAHVLRLRGHVRPARFEEVLAGFVPHTDTRLGRMRDGAHQHRPGLDITLSAPKSVSLEGLVFGERAVVRAHDEAVRATLDWVESDLLQTRSYDRATGRRPRVRADGMVAAGFRHLTSRNQDPQLHTHCVVANMTRSAEGAWRSLETTKVRRAEKLIGAYYRNALAQRLQALGYAIAPTLIGRMPGFEIAGYDRALLDAFSGRRREILEALEANGLPYTPALAQMAALHTRRRKVDIGLGALIPQWRARAHELGLSRFAADARPPRPLDPDTGKRTPRVRVAPPSLPANVLRNRKRAPALPDVVPDPALDASAQTPTRPAAPATLLPAPEVGVLEAVARAVAAIEERMTVFPETEVQALALGHAPGRYTLGEIDAAIERLVRDGALVETERRGADRAFVTDRAVSAERRILAMMREGRNTSRAFADPSTVETRGHRSGLTAGQRRAVAAIAGAPDWLVGVQGHAGAGKTTMLREAAALPGMALMHGLAPSSAAARALARESGIETRTLQWFLARYGDLTDTGRIARGVDDYAGTVLVVDEASMVGTVQMEALLRIARGLDVARVVLVGDTRQLRAVDAGQPFRVLQRAGMATTVMDEVLRQRDPTLAAAVAHAREGHPELALRTLGEQVRESARDTLGEAAGAIWLALPDDARADTAVLAPTHAMRREIHAAIREGLVLEGTLHGRALAIERLVDRRLTRADTADIASYAEGDTVVFHRDAYGCGKDDVCTVTRVGDNAVELACPDGTPRRFRPSGNAARNLGVFDTAVIDIRAGERIRWTRNRKAPRPRFGRAPAPDLVNGDTARVLAIDDRRVHFVTEHGERIGLRRSDPQLRHLDHAYSSTVHAAQGKTARSVLAVLDSAGLSDQTLLYVEMSRASDACVLLTDDREALAEVLVHRPGREEGALEAIGEALTAAPVVEPEVFDALRAHWGAVRTRAESTGDLPYFTEGYTEVMARAAALSAIEDLPGDMRAFTTALLAEHKRHRERERTVTALIRRMQSHGRRCPGLGRSAEASPRHLEWRTEADTMLDTARAWLGGDADTARHLDAAPERRAGLETAVRGVERVRARTDHAVFERRWHAVRAQAAREGIPPIDAAGYADVAALVEALARTRRALSVAQSRTLDAWRDAHGEAAELRARMERYPREAAALVDARSALDLAADADGGFDPAHPAYRRWRAEADALAQRGAWMLAPHLQAHPERRARVASATAALADAVAADDRRAFAWLLRDVSARAESAATLPFDTARHDELAALARILESAGPLPPDTRQRVDAWRAHDERCRRRRAEIAAFPERAAALIERGETAALLESAGAMLSASHDDRLHLDAMPGVRNRIAAALVSLHRAMESSTEAPRILPCRERVVAGDRVRWTVGDTAGRVYGIRGELPRLDCVVEAVLAHERPEYYESARLRIEASPDGTAPASRDAMQVPMETLLEHDCRRAPWADEDERARIEAHERHASQARERAYRLGRARKRGRDWSWTM